VPSDCGAQAVRESSRCARNRRAQSPYVEAMTLARQRLGQVAEQTVAEQLHHDGWRILERNARTRYGELDLVGLDREALVFVEVKAGRAGTSGGPARPVLAVGPAKQRRIRTLARAWLAEQRILPRHRLIRFDAVGVLFDRGGNLLGVEHVRDAF
jgi:putative endonuclease